MPTLKVSLITVCYNAEDTIERCIQSVIRQDYPHIEYLIIDGASADGTLQVLKAYQYHFTQLISEPDAGLYDAMNKGIALATGDVIGILNADDYFISSTIISSIAEAFSTSGADIVYGNLKYVNPYGKVIRKWGAGGYKPGAFNRGWMPPHPTFYAKAHLFKHLGVYKTDYGSAADYELMLRFMHNRSLLVYYLDLTFLHMQTGGVSNKSVTNRVKAMRNDLKAMENNKVKIPLLALILKPLRKVFQYL